MFGIALMAFGAIGLVLGVVHLADPKLKQQSDPFLRIAQSLVSVVDKTGFAHADQSGFARKALSEAKHELRDQARQSATDDLVRSAIVLVVGFGVYIIHERKIAPRPAYYAPPPAT